MKNRIRRKLASERGASITFALLLFLVCAVLCSVILAAATAASGRMSRIAETDQRYYSVTSAAELLKDLIDGETVSYVEVTDTWTERTYLDGVAGGAIPATSPTGETAVTRKYLVKGGARSGDDYGTPITNASAAATSIPEDAAYRNASGDTTAKELKLASSFFSSGAGADYDAYAVTVEESFDANGNMKLVLYNTFAKKAVNSVSGSRYSMVMDFGLNKQESSDTKSVDVSTSSTTVEDGKTKYTVKTKTTTTMIKTYTWTLTDIRN